MSAAAAPPHGSKEPTFTRSRLLGRGALLGLSAVGAGALVRPPLAGARGLDGDLNLLSFGAAGDGIGDDTSAFARALQAMSPGAKLMAPQGKTFRISSSLVIDRACTIDLQGGTVVKSPGMKGAAFVVAADAVRISNLTLDGARGAAGGGFEWRGAGGEMTDVAVLKCHSDGVLLSSDARASLTCRRVRSSGHRGSGSASGFSVLKGYAKFYDCSAEGNEWSGFFFGVSSEPGSHLNGVARRNFIGCQIRNRGGTSDRFLADGNTRYGLVLDYDGDGPRPGGWSFGHVECNRTGVRREASGTGIELLGADSNTFKTIVSNANPGYGLALAHGSSGNTFGSVRCDQRGSGDGDPGLHISGGSAHNSFGSVVIANHTYGVVFGEGLEPKSNDLNSIGSLTVTGCAWGVLRLDSGTKNTIGRLLSRRNSTIDPRIMRGLVEFRSDANSNFIGLFDHKSSRRSHRRISCIVRADRGSRGNVIAHGHPWRQLRRFTQDHGRNSFFRTAAVRSRRRVASTWTRVP
jgi:hypothetical protein